MSYHRIFGFSLIIPLLCLTIAHSANAQSRTRSRVVTRHGHQFALADQNRLSGQRSQRGENSRIHSANIIRTGLKDLFTYRSDTAGPGASYLRNKALPLPQPAAADADYSAQQPRPRTYHRLPRYDNYTGDLVIPARKGIGFKLRIGNGTAYPY